MGEIYRAGLPMLGARLLAAAQFVPPGCTVADIGCDHGKLAVWLAIKGDAEKVIAVDNNTMPLARAKALVRQTNCGQVVCCRLGNGLFALEPREAEYIVIAGLSASSIVKMLEEHSWVFSSKTKLVLVPAGRPAFLRAWLCKNGFKIKTEKAVLEKNRAYAVMQVQYSGKCFEPSDFFCQMGALVKHEDKKAISAYAAARLRDLKKQEKGLGGKELLQHKKLILEVEKCLQ